MSGQDVLGNVSPSACNWDQMIEMEIGQTGYGLIADMTDHSMFFQDGSVANGWNALLPVETVSAPTPTPFTLGDRVAAEHDSLDVGISVLGVPRCVSGQLAISVFDVPESVLSAPTRSANATFECVVAELANRLDGTTASAKTIGFVSHSQSIPPGGGRHRR